MRELPREPIPGYDRVAVRVPEHHSSPVYRPGQRIADQPDHGQFTRDPQAHDVVVWNGLYYNLYREGALELVGLLQPGACAKCRELPWLAEHAAADGHHPACPDAPPAAPAAPAPVEDEEPAPAPAPAAPADTITEER